MHNRILLLILLVIGGCSQPEKTPNRAARLSGKSLTETIQENRERLLSISGVINVQADDCGVDSCIKIIVRKKTEMLVNQLPPMLETWRVDLVEGGN